MFFFKKGVKIYTLIYNLLCLEYIEKKKLRKCVHISFKKFICDGSGEPGWRVRNN